MFGWEFPPLNSGGLGTACLGLTKALAKQGIEISFVLPKSQQEIKVDFMKLIIADNPNSSNNDIQSKVNLKFIDTILTPYMNAETYTKDYNSFLSLKELFGISPERLMYGPDLFREVARYTQMAESIAYEENYDVIHCHDWMTIGAGVKAKRISRLKGKVTPLVMHVHATEFDRTGGNPNEVIYEIEKFGMENADQIVTVSNYTKNIISYKYGIPLDKISVVHNGLDINNVEIKEQYNLKKHYKLVLYLGRVTLQKGPDWFLKAAKIVCDKDPSIRFIFSGNGDMFPRIVEESANLGIADKIFFTNWLRGIDIERAYEMADLYVMPSVSEPFGLTALEALNRKTPILISKQSGVSEVIENSYKVDFWDTCKMADSMIEILNNKELYHSLSTKGYEELKNVTWDNAASKCINIYNKWGGGNHS
jgi:glycogen synthase